MRHDAFVRLTPLSDSTFAGFTRRWPDTQQDFRVQAICQHEQQMLRLAADAQVPGVSVPADTNRALNYHTPLRLTLLDLELNRLDRQQRLNIAIALTEALASLHQQDIFHLSLRPGTFLISDSLDYAELIDLSAAQHCPRGSLGLSASRPLGSDIAWLSPEQSYPADRLADNRTDLYSLGCVLVWLFSGKAPFDHLNGEHAIAYGHIAGQPALPVACADGIDMALQQLLKRLLEKEADNRYQSCAGVLQDLRSIRAAVPGDQPLSLNRARISDRFHIPQRLYGRADETRQLLAAFERVRQGPSEAILIGGYSGVGKSALVHEIHTPILKANGLFVSGKFDQYQRGTPYSALVQAFTHFISYLLALPDPQVERWRSQLNQALAPNAQVMVELIPELGQLLGPQPALPPLGPDEQQNRFNRTFLSFVREICSFHKPLVIFIDDLQWADLGSIRLLELLLTSQENRNCLIVGAYRDNEVDERHPFMRMLADLGSNTRLQQLELKPLPQPVLTELIAATVHKPVNEATPLAELIFSKTDGNPFFVRQFMQELYQRGLLAFDYSDNGWQWSTDAIEQQAITDNVVELMLQRIERLPKVQQTLLQQAACIGARFSLALLSQLNDCDEAELYQQLQPIFSQGLLLPVRSRQSQDVPTQVRFLHDRVQQAASARLNSDERAMLHLQLGRLLLDTLDTAGREEQCFELVGHFNKVPMLLSAAEIPTVLQLNHCAALKAREATAYTAAVSLLETALQLAARTHIDNSQQLDIQLQRLECLYLAGEFELAEALKTQLYPRCNSPQLQARYHSILITQYTRFGDLQGAINQGLTALAALNWPMPAEPTMNDIGAAIADAQQQLASTPFETLATLGPADDPEVLLRQDILMAMQPCCYNSGSPLFPLTILGLLKLTMAHGNTPYSSYVYMMYGLMCTKVLKDYDTAFEAAHYSADVARNWPANPLLEGRLKMMRSNFILPWQTSLPHSSQEREDAYHQCLEQGDYYWGVHSYIFGFYSDLLSMPSLNQLLERTRQLQSTCEQINQPTQVYLCQLQINLLRIIQGTLDNPLNLDHRPGYEAEAVQHYQQNSYMCGKYDRLLGRLLQGYLQGNYAQTLEVSLSPELTMADLDEGIFHEAAYTLFNLLCLLALQLRGQAFSAHQQQWWDQAWPRYQRWYQLNPDNFAAGYHLLQAEQLMLQGDNIEARCEYERATGYAARAGQALLQGIASERFAHFYHHQDDASLCRAWLEKALKVYQDWGAHACADRMESRLASFNDQHLVSSAHNLDWHSVLDATQEIVQKRSATEVIENALQRAASTTGARQVALFQPQDEAEWELVSYYRAGEPGTTDEHSTLLPQTILNYCRNSHKTLTLSDAINHGNHVLDEDIQRRQVRSVLALPLMVQQRFAGVLYLEHDASTHLFTAQKVRVMELLAGQFAVVWQNTRYYEQLKRYNEQLEQTVTERTRQLDQKNHHLESILQALPIPFVVTTVDGDVIEGNEQVYQLFELPEGQRSRLDARNFYVNEQDRNEMLQQLQEHGVVNNFECQLKTARGNLFWAQFSVTLLDLERGRALFSAVSDISDRKKREDQLHQQATTDPLTGALNRRAFVDQAQLLRKIHPKCQVAMLDLDHFKALNDRWGHAAGDKVLRQFVKTLQQTLHEGDLLCRLGGEEFALVLHRSDASQASQMLQQICRRIAGMTISTSVGQLTVTTSAGLTFWAEDEPLSEALERADRLLYQAKDAGRNQVQQALHPGLICNPPI